MPEPSDSSSLRSRLTRARRRWTAAVTSRGALVTLGLTATLVLAAVLLEAGFWMSADLRLGLVALIAGGCVVALIAWVIRPLFHGLGWLPGLDDRRLAQEADREHSGVADRLTAWLDLDERRSAETPDALRSAAMEALARDLKTVPFERTRFDEPLREVLPWAAMPVLTLAALLLFSPSTFGDATDRLLAPTVAFTRPAPYSLTVTPGDTALVRGAPLAIRADAAGREIPPDATLEIGRAEEDATESVLLRRGADGAFTHEVASVQAGLRYRLVTGAVTTPWFEARVEDRPLVRGLAVTVSPPRYSGRSARRLPDGIGDVTALPGATVSLRVALGGEAAASGAVRIRWKDGRGQTIPLAIEEETGRARFTLRGPGRYRIHLESARGVPNAAPASYVLGTLRDAPPQITLTEGASAPLSEAPRRFRFRVTDDFGLSSGALVWQVRERAEAPPTDAQRMALPLQPGDPDQHVSVTWVPDGLRPGDVIELYGEVRDTDVVHGRKRARTPLYTLRFPTRTEQLDRVDAASDSTGQSLDRLREESDDARRRMDELEREIRRNPRDVNWEDRRQAERVQQEQQALQREAASAQQRLQQQIREMRQSEAADPDLMRQFEALEEVFEELQDPRLQETLRQLREAMEALDMRNMLERAQQAQRQTEQFEQRLQRAQQLLERLETAREMQELSERAEALADEQDRITRETEQLGDESPNREAPQGNRQDRREDSPHGRSSPQSGSQQEDSSPREMSERDREALAEAQREAAERARELQEQAQQTRERAAKQSQQAGEQMQDAQRSLTQPSVQRRMRESAQQIQQGRSQEARQSQQQSAQQLRRFARQMQQAEQQMQSRQQQVNKAAIRRALENVLTLSRRQEELANETAEISDGAAELRDLARQQARIQRGFTAVTDTLRALSNRIPQLRLAVTERAQNAERELTHAAERLSDRRAGPAAGHQRSAMASLNELALLLTNVLDEMQPSGQGSGGGGMSQQLQQTGQQQQQLNQQIQQFLNETAGQRLQRGDEQRARQLGERQERIRQGLQRMIEQGAASGEMDAQTQSALRRVEEQMQEAARSLRRRRLNGDLPQTQQQILQRLLETERSVNQRDRKPQREAQTAESQGESADGDTPPPTSPAERIRSDLIRALQSGYARDYHDLIKRYFERLQGRVSGG